MLQRSPMNGTMHLQMEAQESPLVIGMQGAGHLFVELLAEDWRLAHRRVQGRTMVRPHMGEQFPLVF